MGKGFAKMLIISKLQYALKPLRMGDSAHLYHFIHLFRFIGSSSLTLTAQGFPLYAPVLIYISLFHLSIMQLLLS